MSRPAARLEPLTQVAPEQPLHRALGLTDSELERIVELLEREPNDFELAVFSLLWSEHCGYKHSALLLKRLPSQGERVLQGPGENAGVIDIGEGEAVAFKVESHNHPSAVEPFQGAATGVGGILRDIVAMGARPIAILDGLRFGAPDHAFRRAVAGIGHYGNSVGVATVGGEAVFDDAYADNCLVNAMCVGLLPSLRLLGSRATVIGGHIVLYGATTGRDGIGGASVLASAELGEDDPDKRPSVQIGDPFTGKKLIEASLELVEGGLVESLQDCGAAGLASSLAEMARDGAGIDVHLDRVPLREAGLEPWEIMISESQERMVAVVRPEMLAAVARVCATWELPCTVIGEVTDNGLLRALYDDEVAGEIPARFLTDECPRYELEPEARQVASAPVSEDHRSPKAWIYEQYDQLVGSRTVKRPGLDAAVLRLRPSLRGIAVSLQGPPAGERDPFRAGVLAVLGAARNVACSGGRPLALSDCLNFGSPEKSEIAWELEQAIEGIAQAAEALGIPVVSGNVSLYNDTDGRSIPPTPVVGCVGLVPDVRLVPRAWRQGDAVLVATAPGELDLAAEAELIRWTWKAAPLLTLAHDVSTGGLEAALSRGSGAQRPRGERRAAAAGDGRPDADRLRARGRGPARGTGSRAHRDGALMCGLFGIHAADRDVARVTYFGLFALQHRGQESAGIAVSDGGRLTALRDMGLVTQVFDEQKLRGLHGELAIGHTRYSTTGSSQWWNAQPLVQHGSARTIALGHNGNLTNAAELREELAAAGHRLATTADSEVIAALIANDPAQLEEAVAAAIAKLEGAFSVVALSEGKLLAFRDAHGFRPLCIGRLGEDWVVASETCALDLVGAEFEREVEPGELVAVDEHGLHAVRAVPQANGGAFCIFEFFYLARPDSRLIGVEVHGARVRMGERLAQEAPVEADLVLPIPDSGTPAAIGFSRALGIPFSEGLIKNRYVGRTFIEPDQGLREQGIKLKFNPLAEVEGKRVVAVDDSIVRGNTTRQIVQMLFDAGAAEVHVRISSPPVIGQCFYGIDFADPDELIASDKTVEEIREHLGATSLAYISLEGLQASTQRPESQFCRACLTRDYPTRSPTRGTQASIREGLALEHS